MDILSLSPISCMIHKTLYIKLAGNGGPWAVIYYRCLDSLQSFLFNLMSISTCIYVRVLRLKSDGFSGTNSLVLHIS